MSTLRRLNTNEFKEEAVRLGEARGYPEAGRDLGNWTPDGKSLVFKVINPDTGSDVWVLTYEDGWTASALLETADDEGLPQISPDGSLMVHNALTEAGLLEAYVRRFLKCYSPRSTQVDSTSLAMDSHFLRSPTLQSIVRRRQ